MKIVRLMLPQGIGPIPRNGYAVCIGNFHKPKRQCEWLIVDFYTDTTEAHNAQEQLSKERESSAALVLMSYEWVKIISPCGQEVYCGHGFKKKQRKV